MNLKTLLVSLLFLCISCSSRAPFPQVKDEARLSVYHTLIRQQNCGKSREFISRLVAENIIWDKKKEAWLLERSQIYMRFKNNELVNVAPTCWVHSGHLKGGCLEFLRCPKND